MIVFVILLLLGIFLNSSATSAEAQSAALSTISTDTGAFAPGRTTFTTYDRPGLCLAAATATLANARRTLDVQILRDTIRDESIDTVGVRAAAAVVRGCGTQFLATDTATGDLPTLFALARMMQNDTLALRILDMQVARAQTPAQQATLRLDALTSFLGVERTRTSKPQPPLMHAATTLVSTLAHDTAFTVRLSAQERMLAYWESRDSLPALQQAATELVALFQHAPAGTFADQNIGYMQYEAYADLMMVALLRHPDSMQILAAQAKRDSLSVPIPMAGLVSTRHYTVAQIVDHLSPIGAAWDPQRRTRMQPVHANFWYPSGADTLQPIPGKVTLFVVGGKPAVARRMHRWLTRYGAHGLTITVVDVVDDTAAYWFVPGILGGAVNGPYTPAARAEQLRWYYRDYEHLPVVLAVQTRHVRFPDWPGERRTVVTRPPFERVLREYTGSSMEPGSTILVGRDGGVVWAGNMLDAAAQRVLDHVIAWTMAQPTHVPATTNDNTSASAHGQ